MNTSDMWCDGQPSPFAKAEPTQAELDELRKEIALLEREVAALARQLRRIRYKK